MLSKEEILRLIKNKSFPIDEENLVLIREFVNSSLRFHSIDRINNSLREDWLNKELDPIDRARKNIGVESSKWRNILEIECEIGVRKAIDILKWHNKEKWCALLIWRGALAYLRSLHKSNITPYHIKLNRDEKTLGINIEMPLSEDGEYNIRELEYDCYIIPDPMLATGNSVSCGIKLLMSLGVPTSKIIIISVISSPEGVLRLLSEYPNVRIITNSLDDHLNKDDYIIDGLGDCGDKYFFENDISNFKEYREMFDYEEWKYLNKLMETNRRVSIETKFTTK